MSDLGTNQDILNPNQFEGPKSPETIERQEALEQKFEESFKDLLLENNISSDLISKIGGLYSLRGDLESDIIDEDIIKEALNQLYPGAEESTKSELLLEVNSIFKTKEIDESWEYQNETIENNEVYSKIEETFGQEITTRALENMSVEGNIITALTLALNINSLNSGEKKQDTKFENVILEQNKENFDKVFNNELLNTNSDINKEDLEEIKGLFFIEDDLVQEIVNYGENLPSEIYEKILNAINLAFSIGFSKLMESHGNIITNDLVQKSEKLYDNNTSLEERIQTYSEIKEKTYEIPGILKSTKRRQIERFKQIEEAQIKARLESIKNPILKAKENFKKENEEKYKEVKNELEDKLNDIEKELFESNINEQIGVSTLDKVNELIKEIQNYITYGNNESEESEVDDILAQI